MLDTPDAILPWGVLYPASFLAFQILPAGVSRSSLPPDPSARPSPLTARRLARHTLTHSHWHATGPSLTVSNVGRVFERHRPASQTRAGPVVDCRPRHDVVFVTDTGGMCRTVRPPGVRDPSPRSRPERICGDAPHEHRSLVFLPRSPVPATVASLALSIAAAIDGSRIGFGRYRRTSFRLGCASRTARRKPVRAKKPVSLRSTGESRSLPGPSDRSFARMLVVNSQHNPRNLSPAENSIRPSIRIEFTPGKSARELRVRRRRGGLGFESLFEEAQ